MNEKQKTSIWERFTNQYSLSKTLRFELKPVGQTQKMLEEEKIFEKDETIKKKYEATKPYFDRLHREFVEEALQNVALSDLGGYFETYKKWKADKKKWGKELQNKEKNLRKELVTFFDAKAKDWSKNYQHINIKKKDVNILFEESVFQILKERYGKEEESRIIDEATGEIVSIFDSWKGFTGYFTKFQETRKNFYKDDGNSTAIATRIIDQNLKRFCDNIQVFNSIKERISFSEIAENFEKSEEEIFSVEHYNPCILQKGIDTYNQILGGQTLKNGEKKKGVNELINLKRQKTGERMSFLKLLDKQILSEKELFIDEIESDEKLLELLKNFQNTAETKTEILRSLFGEFLKNQEKYNLSHIYLSKEAFNTVAHKWTRETDLFEESLFEVLKKEKIVSGSKKKDKGYPFPDFIALEHVKNSLERIELSKFWKDRYYKSKENPDGFLLLSTKEKMWSQFLTIFKNEFSSLFKKEIVNQKTGQIEKFGYDISKSEFEELAKDFTVNEKSKVIIKNFADDVLKIYQMVKYFALEKKRAWNTEFELDVFYTNPEDGYLQFYENAYEEIVQPYNKIRNYLTRRPYNEEKWKLNFECSYLLGGWSSEFETYGSLLFEKNGKYYLGVINGKAFAKEKRQKLTEGVTERNKCYKMIYDFQKPDNKNVPRLFIRSKGDNFSPAVKELNLPIETVLDIYDQGLFKTENKNHPAFKESLTKMIDYFKLGFSRHNSYKHFPFKWKESSEYKNIADFYQDTIRSCYQLQWEKLNFDEIRKLTESSLMYVFEVYNKDFSAQSSGAKNLHTLYFQSLFFKENLENKDGVIFKLSGGGEIFFRPKTKKEKLGERKDSKGKSVVRNKRYSKDKMFLHFPIELNYARSQEGNFNAHINNFLANNSDINIIGVDRGEKHLAYYSVINQKGEVLESASLNEVNGVNYAEKLEERAKKREQERKDWQTIEGIKDLKKGYISQVVRKIADLAIKHNAIVVFEDLNMRFKQIRGGIEKSIYQQLEKALIEKLSFLVEKGEKDASKAGHLLKAFQLAAPIESFQDMGKQTGILFYTQAAYTSKIDPVTGWRPSLRLKYTNAEKAKADILKFSKIEFKNQRFEFTYDIKNFRDQKEWQEKTKWTVCSCVERFRWNRNANNNKGGYDHYEDLTENFKSLFTQKGLHIAEGEDILKQIRSLEAKGNEKFFKEFTFLFNLICQIRNTDDSEKAKKEEKDDFILSPVEQFFDSRNKNDKDLPKNGDDNGAYNIAKKGVILLQRISEFKNKNSSCKKMTLGDLYISDVQWDNFAQKDR